MSSGVVFMKPGNILCKMFRHKIPRDGYYLNAPYFIRGSSRVTDGIGRKHQSLEADCARCGKRFTFGYIHDYPEPKKFEEESGCPMGHGPDCTSSHK